MIRFCNHCQKEIKSQRWTYGLCPACRQAYRNKEKIVARALWNLDRVEKIEKIVSEHKMVRNFKIKTLREKKMEQEDTSVRPDESGVVKTAVGIKKYQIIYADPPWNFNFQKRNGLSDEAKGKLYPTMKGSDIISLPVKDLADDNSILFLWVMNSEIPLALDLIKNWGFKYKTVAFTWVKTTKNTYHFGGGNWTRSNPELCLLATKGTIKRESASVRNLVISPLREHSRKPDEIRNAIIDLVGDLPRIELFARQKTEGWDVWGNEVESDIKL